MGLDIYSGKLVRYYSNNWETIVQQLSKEQGYECKITDILGRERKAVEDCGEVSLIRKIVNGWIDNLASVIDPSLRKPLWDESAEDEYYTDKPDWGAYGALLMLQACSSLNLPLPEYVDGRWSAVNHPIVKEAKSKNTHNSLLKDATFWIPVQKELIMETALPSGAKATISTVPLLKKELEELNQKLWKADEATILSWRDDNYYIPIELEKEKTFFGFIRRIWKRPKERFRTEQLAKCAYSIFYEAVCFAERHHVPILLDY